ncbi:MAG: nucleotidyltransferase family protein [Pseudomonadota bacterium]
MSAWKNILVSPGTSILETIEVIDKAGLRAAIVIDEQKHLLGMVTDGDIRRSILKKIALHEPIHKIMNTQPTVAREDDSRDSMLTKLQSLSLFHLPIINDERTLVGFETLDNLLKVPRRNNMVVVMAGGMGKRLHPITVDCPKPMIKVGNKPVLEILIENYIKHGFHHFCLAVNYKSEMIKDYFGNGERWGVTIEYVQENQRLGTAGALSILNAIPEQPFFVINADVITNVDFQSLLHFHLESAVEATMCIREQEHTILYGVVERREESHLLKNIIEKPVSQFFVNAGIYVLDPKVLTLLAKDTFCDMPNLLMTCLEHAYRVATFPIKEYWLDIGHHQDLQRAHDDYEKVF